MKINWIVCLLAGMWLISCSPDDPMPNEDVSVLYQQFHGKYKVVSSVSNEAIDVDLDGKISTDMTEEIPQLAPEYGQQLELRIYGTNKYRSEKGFLFTQAWPEQYIWTNNKVWDGEPIEYQPGLIVNFVKQGSVRYFSFSTDLKQISVQPNEQESSFRWGRPESVTVEANGRLRVVNKRRLYTRTGVKEVVITTVYERYTMST